MTESEELAATTEELREKSTGRLVSLYRSRRRTHADPLNIESAKTMTAAATEARRIEDILSERGIPTEKLREHNKLARDYGQ